jgi:ubiquinone/menaquinone biosynthesis C-methylase UbiE
VRSGQRVLDVAAGNGNVTLAAARRWCDVVSTDYVPELLERGRARAQAEGLSVEFKIADAEALPFADNAFDMVVSTFGVMFTTNPEKAAAEQVRVCKRGGKIGLANWTPDGFIGQMFKVLGKHLPPPPGAKPPPQRRRASMNYSALRLTSWRRRAISNSDIARLSISCRFLKTIMLQL